MLRNMFLFFLVILASLFFSVSVSAVRTCSSPDDITCSGFEIRVGEMTPGGTDLIKDGAGETVNNFLEVVLSKLIIVF